MSGEDDKFAAFKLARAALAASGTVTLELALAGTPMVVAYRADPIASSMRFLLIAHSVVLPNLILGENVFPELLNKDCNGEALSRGASAAHAGRRPSATSSSPACLAWSSACARPTKPRARKAARIVLAYAERRTAALVASFQRASTGM